MHFGVPLSQMRRGIYSDQHFMDDGAGDGAKKVPLQWVFVFESEIR